MNLTKFSLAAILVAASACSRGSIPTSPPIASGNPVAVHRVPHAVGIERAPLTAESERRVAGSLAGATAWLNVDRPLAIESLRGRVVVVDFWTSCCINCIQTLPILATIESKFANEPVAVIGIHSPKFDAETERERLRAAIGQYSITHPIAVDGSMAIWKAWKVSSWPTVMVIDAKGRIAWAGSGEPNREELEGAIASALDEGDRDEILATDKLAGLRVDAPDTGPLAFPGKAIALADGGTAIADTGHHRIVIADASGAVRDVVGSGLAGKLDGGFGDASFRKPQGLAEAGDLIYVADTENHVVRAIDRRARTVSTIAGTGELGEGRLTKDRTPAITTKLRSPWDVAFVSGTLYIALAGSHQIAAYDPSDKSIHAFAGDGHERRRDGSALDASFAQPSGLASDGATLFVADSETSSIRAIDLRTQAVRTIVGRDLFVFGDVDGTGDAVRLQHPIGIAFGGGSLWIADTYNSKVKKINPRTGETKTFAGGSDRRDLFEPNGLFVRGNKELVVADTNHNRLVRFPIATANATEWLPIGLTAPSRGVAIARAAEDDAARETIRIDDVAIGSRAPTSVHVAWTIPQGSGVNEDAPFRVRWRSSDGLSRAPEDVKSKGANAQNGFDVTVAPIAGATTAKLLGDVDLVLCDVATHRVCTPVKRAIAIAFRVDPKSSDAQTSVRFPLPAAAP